MITKQFLPRPVFAKLTTIYSQIQVTNPRENLSPFAEALKDFLTQFGEETLLNPGEVLFEQDASGENMYWIESGALAVVQGKLTNPQLLTFRRPGQVVGEIALIENVPRTATVAALIPTRLRFLNKEKFQEMLAHIPGVGIELMRLLSSRIREVKPIEYGPGMYDHLTGAFSRQALDLRLQEEIERAQTYQYTFSVVFIDLDRFKEVNDTYGHARGDDILVSFVRRIVADLRTTDLFFRYGGDEFVLILQGINRERGPALVQRLSDLVSLSPIYGDPLLFISFTVGMAYYPADGETPEALLQAADRRLYETKKGRNNRVESLTINEAEEN